VWLEHPSYIPARDRLVEYLRSDNYRFRRLKPVLFLCGGASSNRRDTLREYLRKHAAELSIFYAERVWEQIASATVSSALEMESDLAALADLVIVIVESPGTFTELGAFSLSDPLRKKLLPIVDVIHKDQHSFISSGPLRWIDLDSKFAPTIYVSLDRILESVDEIEDRIERIKLPTVRISDLAASPKHLLFFLCDLISVVHPATTEMVSHYLNAIAPSILRSRISIPTLIGLGVAMDLLRADKAKVDGEAKTFLSPKDPDALQHPFHHSQMRDLESLRAMQVSVLLTVPDARRVLHDLRSQEQP
jgi:hypothetical protein